MYVFIRFCLYCSVAQFYLKIFVLFGKTVNDVDRTFSFVCKIRIKVFCTFCTEFTLQTKLDVRTQHHTAKYQFPNYESRSTGRSWTEFLWIAKVIQNLN